MIYFDHNATAPYSPSVREYLKNGLLKDWQNPSSIYPKAQILERKIRECKQFAAERLGCAPKRLFWTSGGTESINTILSIETLRLNQLSGFIASPLEHHASLKKLEFLSQMPGGRAAIGAPPSERRLESSQKIKSASQQAPRHQKPLNESPIGAKYKSESPQAPHQPIPIHWAEHNSQGEIDLSRLDEICSKNPRSLLSFLSANNETGVVSDIKAISQIAKKHDCLLHVDAVQTLGKAPLDLEDWGADFASFSGHKIGALKGAGLLYARKPFAPLMFGGGQERGMRAGTYNFPAICSFKLAVQDIDLSLQEKVRHLRDYFENQMKLMLSEWARHDGSPASPPRKESEERKKAPLFFKVNGGKAPRLANTSNIYCGPGISGQAVLLHLAKHGICASAGSACNAGAPEPSHVIIRLAAAGEGPEASGGKAADYARSCIRLSFAPSNTQEEVDFLILSLKKFYSRYRWDCAPQPLSAGGAPSKSL